MSAFKLTWLLGLAILLQSCLTNQDSTIDEQEGLILPIDPGSKTPLSIEIGDSVTTTIMVEMTNEKAIFEGDIVIDLRPKNLKKGQRGNVQLSAGRWPGGVIPYVISNSDPTRQSWVQQAINHWNAVSGIQLIPRIPSIHSNWVQFQDHPSACNSFVGMIGGGQAINVDLTKCQGPHGVIHEIGHAVGLLHEHQRTDRNGNIVLSGAWASYPTNFGITGTAVGPYDGTSIMHYQATGSGCFDMNNDGVCNPSVDVYMNSGSVNINPGTTLSNGDLESVRFLQPQSFLVEPQYYLWAHADLSNVFGNDLAAAARHYWNYGESELRHASAAYDVRDYGNLHNDLYNAFTANSNYQGLHDHWQQWGLNEGRSGSLSYDPVYYQSQNADLISVFGSNNWSALAEHYARWGSEEGRVSSRVFNVNYYLQNNVDVANALGWNSNNTDAQKREIRKKAIIHYHQYGKYEFRVSSPEFSPMSYWNRYTDLQNAYPQLNSTTSWKLAIHYVKYGVNEGRIGN